MATPEIQEWEDAYRLAGSTSRVALAPQIEKLQQIRRKVQPQTWPSCGKDAQGLFVAAMDYYIDGFIAFLGKDETTANTKIFLGDTAYKLFKDELDRVAK